MVAGHGRLAGVSNYLLGDDPGGWLTGVPNYSRVTYRGLYDGVDLDWYANRAGELEFDLTLAPGVDPTGIRLRYTGAGRLTVDASGALVLQAGGHRLRQAPPVVYQDVGGARKPLQGRYVLHGDHRVGFAVAGYDTSLPLVIDPVITYSTYLGARATSSRSGVTSTGPATSTSPASPTPLTSPQPGGYSSPPSPVATATPSWPS